MLINNSQIKAKARNSNIELYRIIVMILIVAHHYMGHSELISLMSENPTSSQTVMLALIGMWGKTGINAFVLITGYFPCKKDASLKIWGICSLVCVFLSMLTVCFFLEYYHSFEKVFLLVTDSNKLLPLATAISSFMFFKNLKLGGMLHG